MNEGPGELKVIHRVNEGGGKHEWNSRSLSAAIFRGREREAGGRGGLCAVKAMNRVFAYERDRRHLRRHTRRR